jgi:3-hydroxybutyryl-CoA dehydrogenase
VGDRPIAIDGAGTLGRRIVSVYAVGGTDVRIFDLSEGRRKAAGSYAQDEVEHVRKTLNLRGSRVGSVVGCHDLAEAVSGAWMVVEAIRSGSSSSERCSGSSMSWQKADAILASNSSSIPTSQMIDKVMHPERVLNTHYQQPPEQNSVELMSCGKTNEGVIDALMSKIPQFGLVPFHVRRESDGFIFNRVWAAIKRA